MQSNFLSNPMISVQSPPPISTGSPPAQIDVTKEIYPLVLQLTNPELVCANIIQ